MLLYYLFRVSIVASLFYACYKLFIGNNTFHGLNRIVLTAIFVVSLVLPFFSVQLPEINWFQSHGTGMMDLSLLLQTTAVDTIPEDTSVNSFPWLQLLSIIYLSGLFICFFRYLICSFRMWQIVHGSQQMELESGDTIYVSPRDITPFSWMRYVVMSKRDLKPENLNIIRHELAHMRRKHSVDLFFADVYCAVFWINPFAWMLKNELRNVHEYQADADATAGGSNLKEYQLLLIRHCVGDHAFAIANNLAFHNLQKRIKMIMKTKSSNKTKWLYSGFIFAAVLSVVILSVDSLQAKEPSSDSNLSEKLTPEIVRQDDKKQDGQVSQASDTVKLNVKISVKSLKRNSQADTICTPDITFTPQQSEKENPEKDNGQKPNVCSSTMHKPLIIVDSKVVSDDDALNSIDPATIDNIEVMKGERAIAAYGEKGENGVIFLTTKKVKAVYHDLKVNVRPVSVDGIDLDLKPLIIVDGVKMEKGFDLGSIDIENMKSVNVLKDKSATDMYGEEGKDGVVIITLK